MRTEVINQSIWEERTSEPVQCWLISITDIETFIYFIMFVSKNKRLIKVESRED